jgi:hypothetical protein
MSTRIDEIKARLAAATPAPWSWEAGDSVIEGPRGGALVYVAEYANLNTVQAQGEDFSSADATLIANAPADIAFLLAKIEELEKQHEYRSVTMDMMAQAVANVATLAKDLVVEERASTVAYLRAEADQFPDCSAGDRLEAAAEGIEHGDHRKKT